MDLELLFEQARQGDEIAANEIAGYFLPKAIEAAQKKFNSSPDAMTDEDDWAISGLNSMVNRIRDGRLSFEGEKQLGAALKLIVARKAIKYFRRSYSEKRGGGQIIGENQLAKTGDAADELWIQNEGCFEKDSVFIFDDSNSLTGEFAEMAEDVSRHIQQDLDGLFKTLLSQLGKPARRVLLILLSRDCSNAEIATELSVAEVSVERYRASIRRKLRKIIETEN